MKQIYCKEGMLCFQYPLESRKVVKKVIERCFSLIIFIIVILAFFGIPLILKSSGGFRYFSTFFFLFLGTLLVVILLVCITIILQILYYRYYFYDVTEKEIIIKKGVVSRKEVIVPFSKIQDIYVDQDFLDRIFGLYDVHLSTAAAAMGSYMLAHMDGVNALNSEALKKMLIERVRSTKTEESGV